MFKIKLHPLFYLSTFLLVVTGHFHDLFIFLSIILFHELGHILAGKIFKWKIKEVRILPFGAITIFDEGINKPLIQILIISIMGPIFQIIFYFLLRNYISIDRLHYSLLFFNLLPIVPLDGSKIFNVLFNLFLPFKISHYLTTFLSFLLVVLGGIFLIFYKFNFLLILVFLLLGIKAFDELKNHLLIFEKFLFERYFTKRKYKRYKYINGIDERKIYQDFYTIFNYDNKSFTEREILKEMFDFKEKL